MKQVDTLRHNNRGKIITVNQRSRAPCLEIFEFLKPCGTTDGTQPTRFDLISKFPKPATEVTINEYIRANIQQ